MQTVILSIVFTSHNSFDFRSDGSLPSPYAYNCSFGNSTLTLFRHCVFGFSMCSVHGSSAHNCDLFVSIYGDFLYLGIITPILIIIIFFSYFVNISVQNSGQQHLLFKTIFQKSVFQLSFRCRAFYLFIHFIPSHIIPNERIFLCFYKKTSRKRILQKFSLFFSIISHRKTFVNFFRVSETKKELDIFAI